MLKRIWDFFKGLLRDKPAPEAPVDNGYEYHNGHFVSHLIDIAGGKLTAEVWVPEEGRVNDWGTAEILAIYDRVYHRAVGNLFALLPYKIKSCVGPTCREPRYNLPWGQWRKIECSWSPYEFRVVIDGVASATVGIAFPWSPPVHLIYGHHPNGHCLVGAKIRNVVIS